jgi:periplasmic divalent cation tolerance protein
MSMGTPTDPPSELMIVLMTAPSEDVAQRIARTLVDDKLAACVNIVPGLRSIYRWEDKTCDDAEVLCLIKTRRVLFDPLSERIRSLHPYEVPEIVAIHAARVSEPYMAWLLASTKAGT